MYVHIVFIYTQSNITYVLYTNGRGASPGRWSRRQAEDKKHNKTPTGSLCFFFSLSRRSTCCNIVVVAGSICTSTKPHVPCTYFFLSLTLSFSHALQISTSASLTRARRYNNIDILKRGTVFAHMHTASVFIFDAIYVHFFFQRIRNRTARILRNVHLVHGGCM